jgi:hypothetical protein
MPQKSVASGSSPTLGTCEIWYLATNGAYTLLTTGWRIEAWWLVDGDDYRAEPQDMAEPSLFESSRSSCRLSFW